MNLSSLPLRTVLMIVILCPLILISTIAGYWRYTVATDTAERIFDRTLIALTLAISRDVTISGGDALSPSTTDMLRNTSGGEVFYHVYGPDGSFVTGYATPPLPPQTLSLPDDVPVLYESIYRGGEVRVARLREQVTVASITGHSAVTVWQTMAGREAFVRQLAARGAILMGILILTVVGVVWFGVRIGLRPLKELQDAIALRSSNDLGVIQRSVPVEIRGVVATLNSLFGQVSDSIASRDRFISDAAHQLRNPIAGMLSLAEAARDAKTPEDQAVRVDELAKAAARASRLSHQLLSFERARGKTDETQFSDLNLNDLARNICESNAERILSRGIELSFRESKGSAIVSADALLLGEAIENLIDNALRHGGRENQKIDVRVTRSGTDIFLRVSDGGIGLQVEDSKIAFSRFGQVSPGDGSGLGLSIVAEIANQLGGDAWVEASEKGAVVAMVIPAIAS